MPKRTFSQITSDDDDFSPQAKAPAAGRSANPPRQAARTSSTAAAKVASTPSTASSVSETPAKKAKRPRRKKDDPEPDYSEIIRKQVRANKQTGQACDRCKVRRMTCDSNISGCRNCVVSNHPCKVTDKTWGQTFTRGGVTYHDMETRITQLRAQVANQQQQINQLQSELQRYRTMFPTMPATSSPFNNSTVSAFAGQLAPTIGANPYKMPNYRSPRMDYLGGSNIQQPLALPTWAQPQLGPQPQQNERGQEAAAAANPILPIQGFDIGALPGPSASAAPAAGPSQDKGKGKQKQAQSQDQSDDQTQVGSTLPDADDDLANFDDILASMDRQFEGPSNAAGQVSMPANYGFEFDDIPDLGAGAGNNQGGPSGQGSGPGNDDEHFQNDPMWHE